MKRMIINNNYVIKNNITRKMKSVTAGIILASGVLVLGGCGSDAKEYYERACEFSESGSYDKAVENFELAINENPEKAEYYIDYGFTLVSMGNFTEAIAQFNKAILSSDENIVDPNNKITRTNNKKAYRGKGIAYYENHDYDNAITYLGYALEIDENNELNGDIRAYLADSLMAAGNYDGAIDVYNEVIEAKGNIADSFEGMAQCYAAMGNYERAIECYDDAIKQNPDVYSYYIGKYNIYVAQMDVENANKAIEDALSIKDNSDESILYKGELYYMMGEVEKASSCLKQAKDDGLYEASYYLAKIYIVTEDKDSAIECLEEYIGSDAGKKSAAAYEELIGLYLDKNDYASAQEKNDAALALNNAGFNQSFRYYQVAIAEGKGDFKEALSLAESYCVDYPNDEEMKKELTFLNTRNTTEN